MKAINKKFSLGAKEAALVALFLAPVASHALEMSLADYNAHLARSEADCTDGNLVHSGTISVYEDPNDKKKTNTYSDFRCVPKQETRRASTAAPRERDPDSECNSAVRFDGQNGVNCQTAQSRIKSVKGRNDAMNQLNMAGAGALQVANAIQVPQTQQAAVDQQALNMKAAILTSVLETTNHGYNASELSKAEDEANSAARGIRSAQQAYDEAKQAGVNAAGSQGGKFKAALSRVNSAEEITTEATADGRRVTSRSSLLLPSGETADKFREKKLAEQRAEMEKQKLGAEAFQKNLQDAGGLDQTASQFDSFEQMRNSTRTGITESKAVAEQANQGASTSRMMALGSALQSAQAIAALRQLQRTNTNLGALPATPPPSFGLDAASPAPTVPQIPGGTVTGPLDPGLDVGGDPFAAMPREAMEGGVKGGGGGAGGPPSKSKTAQVSSGGGGGGLGGKGGGAGASRNSQNRQSIPAGNHDYGFGGGGGRINAFGGTGASNGGDSDIQDAIKSLLGGEGDKNAEAKLQEYRELASVGENQGEGGADDARTLFERVNEKYNDLQNNGII